MRSRRGVVLVVVLLSFAASLVAWAPRAPAFTASYGRLTLRSDPGDYVGGGGTRDMSSAGGDVFKMSKWRKTKGASIFVDGADGRTWWHLSFSAPGNRLVPGSYRDDGGNLDPRHPHIMVGGEGRGCTDALGSFVVREVAFEPDGHLRVLDVTFEQRCRASSARLRGTLRVVMPPLPPRLTITVTNDRTGGVDLAGTATVSGTVTCNKTAPIHLGVGVHQPPVEDPENFHVRNVTSRVRPDGFGWQDIACSTRTTPWRATVESRGTVLKFVPGDATLVSGAHASDDDYPHDPWVWAHAADRIQLRWSRP